MNFDPERFYTFVIVVVAVVCWCGIGVALLRRLVRHDESNYRGWDPGAVLFATVLWPIVALILLAMWVDNDDPHPIRWLAHKIVPEGKIR